MALDRRTRVSRRTFCPRTSDLICVPLLQFPGTKLRRGRYAEGRVAGARNVLLVLVLAQAGSSSRHLPKRGQKQ